MSLEAIASTIWKAIRSKIPVSTGSIILIILSSNVNYRPEWIIDSKWLLFSQIKVNSLEYKGVTCVWWVDVDIHPRPYFVIMGLGVIYNVRALMFKVTGARRWLSLVHICQSSEDWWFMLALFCMLWWFTLYLHLTNLLQQVPITDASKAVPCVIMSKC